MAIADSDLEDVESLYRLLRRTSLRQVGFLLAAELRRTAELLKAESSSDAERLRACAAEVSHTLAELSDTYSV